MDYQEIGELSRKAGIIDKRLKSLRDYIEKISGNGLPVHVAMFTEKKVELVPYRIVDEDGFTDVIKKEEDVYAGIKCEIRVSEITALHIAQIILEDQENKKRELLKKIDSIR